MAAAAAAQLIDLHRAPESFDPADVDGLADDGTTARKRRGKKQLVAGAGEDGQPMLENKGRLQMRAKVPVLEKYRGKRVARKEVFDDGDESGDAEEAENEDEDEDLFDLSQDGEDELLAPPPSDIPGDLQIAGNLEKEYEKLMKQTQQELKVMRTPSASEIAKKDAEARHLKKQLAAWSALVEFRIHLEGALSVAHRLPVGRLHTALHAANDESLSVEAEAVTAASSSLSATMLDLQRHFARQRGVSTGSDDLLPAAKRPRTEAEAWSLVDSQLQPMLDWALGTADEWKEQTRLDARRSFQVLDQSLSVQMQAVADTDPEKLRRRCTPPPGRHKIFGADALPAAESAAASAEESKPAQAAEEHVFDDRDFYVQLLREVLAGGGSPGSSLGGDESKALQAELQGRRASKKRAQAEVERRASKGRKIRYVPIEKLQNFMSSKPRSSGAAEPLKEHAVEALLRSLFVSSKSS